VKNNMIKEYIKTPWKIYNELSRILISPLVRLLFWVNRINYPSNSKFYGLPLIQKHKNSVIIFGNSLQVRSSLNSNPLGPYHKTIFATWVSKSTLKIGENFGITGGAICSSYDIAIGDNVRVGANCTIIDSDFHPLDSSERLISPKSANFAPIRIENDVFIGMNSIILKGVQIGEGSVIGAGSVVVESVPSNVVVAGNPAKIIKELP